MYVKPIKLAQKTKKENMAKKLKPPEVEAPTALAAARLVTTVCYASKPPTTYILETRGHVKLRHF